MGQVNFMGIRVLSCGTFDNLHPGHIAYLEQAAKLGNELCVVVARDENVKRIKGRYPEQNEEIRKKRLAQELVVDLHRHQHCQRVIQAPQKSRSQDLSVSFVPEPEESPLQSQRWRR